MYKTLPPGEKGEWNSTWLSTYSFFFSNFFFFFLAVLGLYCCKGFSPVAASRGYSLVVVLPIAVTYLVAEHGP